VTHAPGLHARALPALRTHTYHTLPPHHTTHHTTRHHTTLHTFTAHTHPPLYTGPHIHTTFTHTHTHTPTTHTATHTLHTHTCLTLPTHTPRTPAHTTSHPYLLPTHTLHTHTHTPPPAHTTLPHTHTSHLHLCLHCLHLPHTLRAAPAFRGFCCACAPAAPRITAPHHLLHTAPRTSRLALLRAGPTFTLHAPFTAAAARAARTLAATTATAALPPPCLHLTLSSRTTHTFAAYSPHCPARTAHTLRCCTPLDTPFHTYIPHHLSLPTTRTTAPAHATLPPPATADLLRTHRHAHTFTRTTLHYHTHLGLPRDRACAAFCTRRRLSHRRAAHHLLLHTARCPTTAYRLPPLTLPLHLPRHYTPTCTVAAATHTLPRAGRSHGGTCRLHCAPTLPVCCPHLHGCTLQPAMPALTPAAFTILNVLPSCGTATSPHAADGLTYHHRRTAHGSCYAIPALTHCRLPATHRALLHCSPYAAPSLATVTHMTSHCAHWRHAAAMDDTFAPCLAGHLCAHTSLPPPHTAAAPHCRTTLYAALLPHTQAPHAHRHHAPPLPACTARHHPAPPFALLHRPSPFALPPPCTPCHPALPFLPYLPHHPPGFCLGQVWDYLRIP